MIPLKFVGLLSIIAYINFFLHLICRFLGQQVTEPMTSTEKVFIYIEVVFSNFHVLYSGNKHHLTGVETFMNSRVK